MSSLGAWPTGRRASTSLDKVLPKVPWDAMKYVRPTKTEPLTLQTSTSYHPTSPGSSSSLTRLRERGWRGTGGGSAAKGPAPAARGAGRHCRRPRAHLRPGRGPCRVPIPAGGRRGARAPDRPRDDGGPGQGGGPGDRRGHDGRARRRSRRRPRALQPTREPPCDRPTRRARPGAPAHRRQRAGRGRRRGCGRQPARCRRRGAGHRPPVRRHPGGAGRGSGGCLRALTTRGDDGHDPQQRRLRSGLRRVPGSTSPRCRTAWSARWRASGTR